MFEPIKRPGLGFPMGAQPVFHLHPFNFTYALMIASEPGALLSLQGDIQFRSKDGPEKTDEIGNRTSL